MLKYLTPSKISGPPWGPTTSKYWTPNPNTSVKHRNIWIPSELSIANSRKMWVCLDLLAVKILAQNYDTIHLALQCNHPQTHMQKQTTKNNLTIYYKTKKHQSQIQLNMLSHKNHCLQVVFVFSTTNLLLFTVFFPLLNLVLQARPTFANSKERVLWTECISCYCTLPSLFVWNGSGLQD